MESLKEWLTRQYLKWQQENERISVRKWSKVLGVNYSYLNNLLTGDNPSTSMQTAYQIGERLNDFTILEILGYPVPDAPLIGFSDEERAIVLDLLEKVKTELAGLSPEERESKLIEIIASAGFDTTDTDNPR